MRRYRYGTKRKTSGRFNRCDSQYLPEQLSEDEIKKLIQAAIAETGAAGPAGMGLVMKVLQPKIAGKADGGVVSGLVKAALAQ